MTAHETITASRWTAWASALLAVSWFGCKGEPRVAESSPGRAQASDTIQIEAGSPRLSFIKVETASEAESPALVPLPGRVTYDEDRTQRFASPIDGRAVSVLVKLGDHVRAGQALIELTSPKVGELQAAAQKASEDLNVAHKSVDRANRLKADGAISDKDVAQIEADFKNARSELARATAHLRALGVLAVDPTVSVALRSQLSGTVVERNVLRGQEVRADAATPLLTLTDLDRVWVLADVYEQDLDLVGKGAPVTVRVPAYAGRTFPGRVDHIGDVVDPVSRTVKVRCVVPNPDHALKPEMFARVEVAADQGRRVLVLPSRAVLNDGERAKIIVAMEGGIFRERRVEVGPDVDGHVRILSGLRPGERVVTDGALFLDQDIRHQ